MSDFYRYSQHSNHVVAEKSFEKRLEIAKSHMCAGCPIILMDDFNRENEADLVVAADKITVPVMAQLIRDGSGIVCLCLTDKVRKKLRLTPMVPHNKSRYGTAFTISIEARVGISTGVSAADRVTTINAAISPEAVSEDLVSPGHIFPLCAHSDGVLGRCGHTEGSIDLAIISGLNPAAVICELMNADGTMMRGEALESYATEHNLVTLTIAELVSYRLSLHKESTPTF